MKVVQIAAICHEANRLLCRALGDPRQPLFEVAPPDHVRSVVDGVQFALANPEAGPADSHENWCRMKEQQGWTYGREKDATRKTHPNLVDFHELSAAQQAKDHLFIGVVRALTPLLEKD